MASAAIAWSAVFLLGACSGTSTGSGAGSVHAGGSAAAAPGGAQSATAAAGDGQTVTAASTKITGCRNLVATAAVKTAVTRAYTRHNPVFHHIKPRPGQFLYGQCGDTRYAATAFELTPGATPQEQVGIQDDGSARKYFILRGSQPWDYSHSAAPFSGGCVGIPRELSQLWDNCPSE
jgi:hypothetical protein